MEYGWQWHVLKEGINMLSFLVTHKSSLTPYYTAQTLRPVPDAVNKVIWAPDDGWCHHPKHVEQ